MHITIFGSGYVGLVSGTCFAEMGNEVTCVDIDEAKLNKLRAGIVPIHEPGLDGMIAANTAEGRLTFSSKLDDSLHESQVIFIAVGTRLPSSIRMPSAKAMSVAAGIAQPLMSTGLPQLNQA